MDIAAGSLTWLRTGIGRAAAPAFSDLDAISGAATPLPPGAESAAGALVFPPILLAANALTASGFAALSLRYFPAAVVLGWGFAAILASVFPLPVFRWRRANPAIMSVLRLHELCSVILGLVWAAFPPLFFDAAPAEFRMLAVALTFAISGIGSLALARVPASAILFCALIAGSLTLTSIKTGGEPGLALAALSLVYSFGVTAMILQAHEASRQRAAAVQEIRKQNGIISLLLNEFDKGATNWLWETGQHCCLTYVSQRLCDGAGKPAASLLGQTLAEAVKASAGDPGWSELQDAMNARQAIDGLIVNIGFGARETWWRITARPLLGDDGGFAGYRGAAHDITGDRRAEAQLIAAKDAAERASATKSHFLAVMSHELRTPLNAIVGFAELLMSRQSENLSDESRADHLRTIADSSRHLQALINDILDATRIEKGTLRLVEQEADAAELVEVAVKMCRDTAEKADTTIVARIVEGVELRGDITRIKQVLINLITNAVKFSPPGGFVNVGFERTASGGLAIAVRDGGVGIRREDIERIFEPFVQADAGTSRRFGGIGLGLSIARKIAMLHGGDVVIESEYGAGTTARLVLPAARIEWQGGRQQAAVPAA